MSATEPTVSLNISLPTWLALEVLHECEKDDKIDSVDKVVEDCLWHWASGRPEEVQS